MCPSFWKLTFDDFTFSGPSLAHLEPELQLFKVDDNDDDGDDDYLQSWLFLTNSLKDQRELIKDQKA